VTRVDVAVRGVNIVQRLYHWNDTQRHESNLFAFHTANAENIQMLLAQIDDRPCSGVIVDTS
jgi:hypothetical protein